MLVLRILEISVELDNELGARNVSGANLSEIVEGAVGLFDDGRDVWDVANDECSDDPTRNGAGKSEKRLSSKEAHPFRELDLGVESLGQELLKCRIWNDGVAAKSGDTCRHPHGAAHRGHVGFGQMAPGQRQEVHEK
jgi:hypothetical protein